MKVINRIRMAAAVGSVVVVVAISLTFGNDNGQDEPVLYDVMESMDPVFRKLRRQVRDPDQNDLSLELIGIMQKRVLVAMGLVPSKAESLPEPERPKFVLAYKRQMVELFSTILDLEAALLGDDNLTAQDAFRKLGAVRRKGHDQFQEHNH